MDRIEQLTQQIQELENKTKELQEELECEKQKKVECPFKYGDSYFLLTNNGVVVDSVWEDYKFDNDALSQGNAFEIEEEAEKESDRRALLKRFRVFRDKCNGDWKPNFKIFMANKYNIGVDYFSGGLEARDSGNICELCLFGYFKNKEDCDRAIELFGDEIKRLFVEESK